MLSTLLVLTALATPGSAGEPNGERLYQKFCRPCHGADGRGDGIHAPFFRPRPRDLRAGDFLQRHTTEDLVARILDGTRLPLQHDPERLRRHAEDTEALAQFLVRLGTTDWSAAERGEGIWIERCETCHGPYGQADVPPPPGVQPPPDLSPRDFTRLPARDFERLVRHGNKGMPALVPPVTADEARALMAFVRLFSPGFEPYRRYCAACHGDDGHPSAPAGDAAARPTVVFDQAWAKKQDVEQTRLAVWHMFGTHQPAMPHLRSRLTEAETRAILEWLRAPS